MYQTIVRQAGGAQRVTTHGSPLEAHSELLRLLAGYREAGFSGKRNAAGVWRLSKRASGRRLRIALYVSYAPPCLN